MRELRLVPCKKQVSLLFKCEFDAFVSLHSFFDLKLRLGFYLAACILLANTLMQLILKQVCQKLLNQKKVKVSHDVCCIRLLDKVQDHSFKKVRP